MSSWCQRKVGAGGGPQGRGDTAQGGQQSCRLPTGGAGGALEHPSQRPTPLPRVAGEDLWHAYNLVREGDRLEATTFRKVQKETGTGSESERVKLRLMVTVEGVEYDAEGGWVGGWGSLSSK